MKDSALGVRFYKQSLVYGYIADFYCPKARMVVEVDGPCHEARRAYDEKRNEALMKRGIWTMRFLTGEVENNLPAVVAMIEAKVRERART